MILLRILLLLFGIHCANGQNTSTKEERDIQNEKVRKEAKKYLNHSSTIQIVDNPTTNTSNKLEGLIKYTCTRQIGEYKMKDSSPKDEKFVNYGLLLFDGSSASYFYVSANNNTIQAIGDSTKIIKNNNKQQKPIIQQFQNLSKIPPQLLISSERTKAKRYIVADVMYEIPWKLSKETKKIQNIECFSAQAEYRGRVWTAWYAPSIPISSGPWKLYGLPGMILEAEDREGLVRFEAISVNIPSNSLELKDVLTIPLPDDPKEKAINTKEYSTLAERDILNAEKMSMTKDGAGSGQMFYSVSGIEIFDFEKNLNMKSKQQKLSDTPKK